MGMCHIPSLMFPHAHSLHSLCVCCMFVFLCLWFIYSQLTILVVAQCSDPKIHPQCDIAWGPQLSCGGTPTLQRAGLQLQKALQGLRIEATILYATTGKPQRWCGKPHTCLSHIDRDDAAGC